MRNLLTRLMALAMLLTMAQGAFAAQSSWTVYLNGAKTSLVPTVMKDGTVLVPLNFPVQGTQEYTLSINTDASTHRVDITRTPKVAKTRGDGPKCYHCNGTGKCQDDYPEGSGVNYANVNCPVCNGTGKCWYCEGTGDKKW